MTTFRINSVGIAQANFEALEKTARAKTVCELRHAIKDASEAARVFPTGHKAGYYLDVCHTFGDELRRRVGR